MRLAFFCLALSTGALAFALLTQVRGMIGYIGLALVFLSAAGMTIAGLFVTDPVTSDARTAHGRLHEIGAMLDALPFAALLISWSLSRNDAWSSVRRAVLWTATLPLLGVLIFAVSVALILRQTGGQFGPGAPVGWPNRIMIVAQCAWLMPVAWFAIRLPR